MSVADRIAALACLAGAVGFAYGLWEVLGWSRRPLPNARTRRIVEDLARRERVAALCEELRDHAGDPDYIAKIRARAADGHR